MFVGRQQGCKISVISQISGFSVPALYRQEKFQVTEGITGKSDTW
jgi:hypothetical protein